MLKKILWSPTFFFSFCFLVPTFYYFFLSVYWFSPTSRVPRRPNFGIQPYINTTWWFMKKKKNGYSDYLMVQCCRIQLWPPGPTIFKKVYQQQYKRYLRYLGSDFCYSTTQPNSSWIDNVIGLSPPQFFLPLSGYLRFLMPLYQA